MSTTPTQVTPPDEAAAIFDEYVLAEAKLQQAKDAIAPLKKKLLSMFDTSIPGAYEMKAGKWVVTVKVPESVKWSADDVAAFYGADLPSYVKRSFSINETDFRRLPRNEQDSLAGARDIVAGSPKVDIEVAK